MSLRGEIQTMPLPDLFQWLEMMKKTGVLTVSAAGGTATERHFFFGGGEVVTATACGLAARHTAEGVCAIVAETLRWEAGSFDFAERPLPAEIAAVNLRLGAQQLVMDAFREMDEAAEAARAVGGADAVAVAAPRPPAPAFSLAEGLRLAIVDRLLQGEYQVPLLPTVVSKIMEITRRENYSLRDLSEVIVTDQVIAAHLLKQANSALYNTGREIDSLPQAVQRLGAQAVTNLVLALSLRSAMTGRDLFLAEKKRVGERALASALLTRAAAAVVKLDREQAFLCGLMMDFGKLVLFSLIQELMHREREYQATPPEELQEIVEAYHPKVGGVVGEKWNLPASVIEAITCHHALAAAREHRRYAAAANLSDALLLGAETTGEGPAATAAEVLGLPAAAALGLSEAQAQSLLDVVPECLRYAREMSS
jgi:HD-like signal output (HDOD) protein